ncbi:hypothetical protein ACPPVO_20275 [Dactylosporangium sp. McL0621]|uniref:hypothetical protein n=1 Tax=Dactylosporangium sp. McL0621 TaxID=3415678 RepID=UPI003CFB3618
MLVREKSPRRFRVATEPGGRSGPGAGGEQCRCTHSTCGYKTLAARAGRFDVPSGAESLRNQARRRGTNDDTSAAGDSQQRFGNRERIRDRILLRERRHGLVVAGVIELAVDAALNRVTFPAGPPPLPGVFSGAGGARKGAAPSIRVGPGWRGAGADRVAAAAAVLRRAMASGWRHLLPRRPQAH